MESWRTALLPKYFRNGIILLLVKKSSTTSLNHCYRKLNYVNHYVKTCESFQRQLQLLAAPHRHRRFLCGKLFVSAINLISLHVIGWVLPLSREIWSQMRWSNFEKGFLTCRWVTFLLEPVHSSENEYTGLTNRRIDLTRVKLTKGGRVSKNITKVMNKPSYSVCYVH